MHVVVGSLMLGVGIAALVFWLIAHWFNKAGIIGIGAQSSYSVDPVHRRELDDRAYRFNARQERVAKRLVPVGLLLIVVGIAVIAA